MARQTINIGTIANDGTGDTLRAAGRKINDNFGELYFLLGGDSAAVTAYVSLGDSGLIFNGALYNTVLSATEGVAKVNLSLPDSSGTLVTTTGAQTLTNKTLTTTVFNTPTFVNARIKDSSGNYNYVINPGTLSANRQVNLPALTTDDTITFSAATQTLTNKTITLPRVLVGIQDSVGQDIISFTQNVSSAARHLRVAHTSTGSNPSISVISPGETNVSMDLNSLGTGSVRASKLALRASDVSVAGTLTAANSFINLTTSTTAAFTLANGTVTGETRVINHKGSGVATITVTSFSNGSTVTLDPNDSVQLIWDGAQWVVTGGYGYTVA